MKEEIEKSYKKILGFEKKYKMNTLEMVYQYETLSFDDKKEWLKCFCQTIRQMPIEYLNKQKKVMYSTILIPENTYSHYNLKKRIQQIIERNNECGYVVNVFPINPSLDYEILFQANYARLFHSYEEKEDDVLIRIADEVYHDKDEDRLIEDLINKTDFLFIPSFDKITKTTEAFDKIVSKAKEQNCSINYL